MKDKDTPLKLVRLWPNMAPNCYSELDRCYGAKLDGTMAWPDYCPLPISAAMTYLVHVLGISQEDAAAGCAELTACWAWRRNKIIYRFDSDLAAALSEQAYDISDTDILPADTLMHLPYPCIYIKAPGILEHMDGFWAWMEFDVNREAPELRIQWVFDTFDYSIPQVLHIIPGGTLKDCYLDTIKTTQENKFTPVDISRPADNARIILTAIQLLLYITAQNADVEGEPLPAKIQVVGSAKKKERGIQDKASEIRAKDVGVRIGAAFRRSVGIRHNTVGNSTAGSARRPHMRRGHWHHYWRGPMSGKRELILLWTAPTMVHGESLHEENVVIYPVRNEENRKS